MALDKLSNYDGMKKIGLGTYGVVYRALNPQKEMVALKRIHMHSLEDGVSATTLREVALLKQLSHRNVVELRSTFFHSSDMILVFECCSGDLKQFMNKYMKRSFKMGRIKKLMFQILNGVSYCHSLAVLHRDIKPQNILINYKTEEVKITDFGLSRTYILPNRSWTHEVVTLWYRPPEVILGCNRYSISVDIWSIGCVFAEILNNNRFYLMIPCIL